MTYADCPSCGATVNVGNKPKMGQMFTCPSCNEVSEVVWLNPVELDWPIDEEEYEFEDEDELEDYDLDEEEDWEDEEFEFEDEGE